MNRERVLSAQFSVGILTLNRKIKVRHSLKCVELKDIPALPTSQVHQKIQNTCQKSENGENYRFRQVFTRAVLRILFSSQ